MVSLNGSEVDAILKHISFNILPGEKVAIIGRAGVEKAALISCLFRFMEPMRGSIKIDGVNIAWVPYTKKVQIMTADNFFYRLELRIFDLVSHLSQRKVGY